MIRPQSPPLSLRHRASPRSRSLSSVTSVHPPSSATFVLPPLPAVSCKLSPVNLPLLSPFPATLTRNYSKAPRTAPVSPFPATLTDTAQLIENTGPLSPLFATLTGHVARKFFICHSYKKHRGWVPMTPSQKAQPPSTHAFDFELSTVNFLSLPCYSVPTRRLSLQNIRPRPIRSDSARDAPCSFLSPKPRRKRANA